uniref:Uncharacterized protein n=1 Tax=Rhodosorus marinus TaxID=101924 RepID=A0A6T6K362_9RHOD|mmetsp:Transcript_11532/g.16659  ORF Transcript_11532/g.16659 Transcript_11532/m.16659 type:complete len:380 (+) Transcript_11532:281-1420(+)
MGSKEDEGSSKAVLGSTPVVLSASSSRLSNGNDGPPMRDPLMATGGTKPMTQRGKQYHHVTLTEPPLYFTPVGKRWSLDILAVSNNSVRAELNDMYYIVQSMSKRRLDLSHDDIDDFYVWFEVFNFFLQGVFELQEQAIFSIIDQRVTLQSTLSPEGRRDFRNTITYELKKIDEYQPRVQTKPPGEVLPQLISFVDSVVPRLLRYYRVMEKHVPPLIEENFEIEEKTMFDDLTMRLIAGQQDPHWFFILYQRGEPRKKMRKEMRITFFRLKNIFVRYAWKRSYIKMKARVKDVHFDIVREFWRRWREAKLEVDEEEAQAEQQLFAADNVQRDAIRQYLDIEQSDDEDDDDSLDDLQEEKRGSKVVDLPNVVEPGPSTKG